MPLPTTRKQPHTLLASAARTTSDTATVPDDVAKNAHRGVFYLDVTAVGADADETLDVAIQGQDPTSGKWFDIVTFTQVLQTGGATSERVVAGDLGLKLRVKWDVAGTTPEFTFSVGAVMEEV